MLHKDQLLSELVDNEVPPDIAAHLYERLPESVELGAPYARLKAISTALKGEETQRASEDAAILESRERVRANINRYIANRPQKPSLLSRIQELLMQRIALPVPAFGAILVTVVVLGLAAVIGFGGRNSSNQASLASNSNLDAASALSSNSPVSLASPVTTIPSLDSNGSAATITIEVQNIRELLKLLEGNASTSSTNDPGDLTFSLPEFESIDTIAEPILLREGQ